MSVHWILQGHRVQSPIEQRGIAHLCSAIVLTWICSIVISTRFLPTEDFVDFTNTFISKVNRQRPNSFLIASQKHQLTL